MTKTFEVEVSGEEKAFWRHVADHDRREYSFGKRYTMVQYYKGSREIGSKTEHLSRGKVTSMLYVCMQKGD